MRKLKLMVPKGRIYEGVASLFREAGIKMYSDERGYRPYVQEPDLEIKIMKPQNIPGLVEMGSHDAGFTGHDWVVETQAKVFQVMDLGLDPVEVVAAVPAGSSKRELRGRKIVVASEYQRISRGYLEKEGYKYVLLQTFGATEVFPPEDADMIIDNTATGRTLKENNLEIVGSILKSSTRFIANNKALKDSWKKNYLEKLRLIFQSILDAESRVMLEMNVPADRLEQVVKILPCMRSPTVSPLYREQGYAVKVAVKKEEVYRLIPLLKEYGAGDILEYELRKVMI